MNHVDVSQCASLEHLSAQLPNEVDARCDACGASWRYERHEALSCPFCAAAFTMAHFSSVAPRYVDFDATGGCTGG